METDKHLKTSLNHSSLWKTLVWILKINVVVWIINILLLGILAFSGSSLAGLLSSGFFSKLTLLETGVALIVAGAIAFSGSASASKTKEYIRKSEEQWSIDNLRKSEKRANKYIVLASIIFAESIAVSLLGA